MHVSMVQLLLCTCTVRLLFIPGGHITDMGKKGVLPEIVEQSGDEGDSINISRWEAMSLPSLNSFGTSTVWITQNFFALCPFCI